MAWRVELSATSEKQLSKIGRPDAKWIVAFLRERVAANDPRQMGKALHGVKFRGLWRYRVGDYRVVFKIVRNEVWIFAIMHRRDVYQRIEARLSIQ